MIAVLLVSAGCETTSDWLKGFTNKQDEVIILGAPGAGSYLSDMYNLAESDRATQAEIFAKVDASRWCSPPPAIPERMPSRRRACCVTCCRNPI